MRVALMRSTFCVVRDMCANRVPIVGLLGLLCFAVQCAGRGPVLTAADTTSVDRADALVRDGCYRCLQEAAGLYAGVADRHARRPPARVVRGLFDATLLLAVRQKEIGLNAEATLARARALGSRLRGSTTSQPSGPDQLDTLIEAAEAVVGDLSGLDSEARALRDDSTATNCFALTAKTARADLQRLEQSALEPVVKAARLSTAQKRIESAEELGSRSALGAAQGYVHAGQVGLARTYIDLAERHPSTRTDARTLRAQIAGVQ